MPMTKAGYEALKQELYTLKNIERPKVINEIATARALGDLSENAEYHSAKDKQGIIESRISELENKILTADVINIAAINSENIKFGCTITLEDEETQSIRVYKIVGIDEADVNKGLISFNSPLAKLLINRKAGDSIELHSPKGIVNYRIIKIAYID